MRNDDSSQKRKAVVVSGVQPTGPAHIGNWAGGFRNWIKLQEQHPDSCYFFIADYHSMTIDYDPKEKPGHVLDLAATLLALGISGNEKRATLFVQSEVPEVTELGWILNTVTPVSEMLKMTQYKDKAERNEKNVNMGLLNYPILQAADILIYGGSVVPVGIDQIQHVETTRVIAKNFNRRFGETFSEPKESLNETPKIASLTDPTRKMSKSLGPRSHIALDDEPDIILEKMKRVPTESSGKVTPELLGTKEYAGVANLLGFLDLFGASDKKKAVLAEQLVKYGELKELVAEVVADYFADFRAQKKKLLKDPKKIRKVLDTGAARAREVAQKTMAEVRQKTGLR